MKKIIFILSIFYCHILTASYENYLSELWDKVSNDLEISCEGGFFPQDMRAFLEEGQEKVLVFFYPKNSVFDKLVVDPTPFMELEEFFAMAKAHGFQVIYCSSHRHLVSFQTEDERNDFITETLYAEPKEVEIPLYFPCKMIIAVLSLEPALFAEDPEAKNGQY